MIILAYIRVSSEKQRDGCSLEVQRETIINYCKNKNLELKQENIYTDVQSGAGDNRIFFNIMRKRIREEKNVKHLIIYDISRLTRSVLNGEIIAKELREQGGSIISVTQGFEDNTAIGVMTRQFLTVISSYELATIISRTAMGRKKRKSEGKWIGGTTFTGFSPVGNATTKGNGKIKVVPKEQEAVALILKLNKQQLSLRDIAKVLATQGYLSRNNTVYTASTIKRIIDRKEFYMNQMAFYKDVVSE